MDINLAEITDELEIAQDHLKVAFEEIEAARSAAQEAAMCIECLKEDLRMLKED